MYLHFTGPLKSIKMASNVTTQGQEAVVCDLCQSPVTFFCRHCGVNLCDPCVLLHLRVKSKFGHDVVDYASKDDNECSTFCKTICEYKSQHLSELSVKVEDVLKIIAEENGRLQSFRHKLETSLDKIQKCLKREVEEKNEGLMKRFLKNKYVSFFLLSTLFYFFFISENSIFSMVEKRFIPNPDLGRKVLEVPSVSSVIDTGFPAREKYNSRLYDMAVTDDQKVWMGGESKELKLFDLQGRLQRTVTITDTGMYICMYNKRVVYSNHNDNSVKKISDDDTVVTMFSTRYWKPYGITESAFGGLLVWYGVKS